MHAKENKTRVPHTDKRKLFMGLFGLQPPYKRWRTGSRMIGQPTHTHIALFQLSIYLEGGYGIDILNSMYQITTIFCIYNFS